MEVRKKGKRRIATEKGPSEQPTLDETDGPNIDPVNTPFEPPSEEGITLKLDKPVKKRDRRSRRREDSRDEAASTAVEETERAAISEGALPEDKGIVGQGEELLTHPTGRQGRQLPGELKSSLYYTSLISQLSQ